MSVLACKTDYTTHMASFPPGSKPHENNWKYITAVTVSSHQTPISSKSKKVVKIEVLDKSHKSFLSETLEFTAASIESNITWNTFEEITIDLSEVGNEYAEDSYNAALVKSGPKHLGHLVYKYDSKDNQFKKQH